MGAATGGRARRLLALGAWRLQSTRVSPCGDRARSSSPAEQSKPPVALRGRIAGLFAVFEQLIEQLNVERGERRSRHFIDPGRGDVPGDHETGLAWSGNRPSLSRRDGSDPTRRPGTALVPLVQEFSLCSVPTRGKVLVTVGGELDVATAPRLRSVLADLIDGQGVRCLVVDVKGLTFIDSAGIYVLVKALKQVRQRGGDLALNGVTPGVHKVLDVCCLTSAFRTTEGWASSSTPLDQPAQLHVEGL